MKMVKKGTVIVVKHILGETAEELLTKEKDMYRFNTDAYVAGEVTKGGFFHLRQARQVIPGKPLATGKARSWPRLRKALHKAGVRPINVPGGGTPIHYIDEIVVDDFSVSGSHFFVIKKIDIEKYLSLLPLDDVGKKHAEQIAQREAEAAAEAYRQAHDPRYIICEMAKRDLKIPNAAEFVRISVDDYRVVFPMNRTNLIWIRSKNVPRVICESPETGISFLSGWTAGKVDPRCHYRIKRTGDTLAYLMPESKLGEVCTTPDWETWFKGKDFSNFKRISFEFFDLYDQKLEESLVYER